MWATRLAVVLQVLLLVTLALALNSQRRKAEALQHDNSRLEAGSVRLLLELEQLDAELNEYGQCDAR